MERDRNFSHTGHNLIFPEWNFRHHVTVNGVVVIVLEYCAALGGACCEEEVSLVFSGRAAFIDQPQVINVKKSEEGLGQSNGHFVLATVKIHSLGCWDFTKQ